jgi:hypothetical protein
MYFEFLTLMTFFNKTKTSFTNSDKGGGDKATSSSLSSLFSDPEADPEPVSMSSITVKGLKQKIKIKMHFCFLKALLIS